MTLKQHKYNIVIIFDNFDRLHYYILMLISKMRDGAFLYVKSLRWSVIDVTEMPL